VQSRAKKRGKEKKRRSQYRKELHFLTFKRRIQTVLSLSWKEEKKAMKSEQGILTLSLLEKGGGGGEEKTSINPPLSEGKKKGKKSIEKRKSTQKKRKKGIHIFL